MAYLVDTHTLFWAAVRDRQLSSLALEILEDGQADLYVSAVSGFEMATKYRQGRWPEAAPFVREFDFLVRRLGFSLLSVTSHHAVRAGSFPTEHRDPFDRLLAAQAEGEGMTLLSMDAKLDQFGVRRVW